MSKVKTIRWILVDEDFNSHHFVFRDWKKLLKEGSLLMEIYNDIADVESGKSKVKKN